MEASYFYLFVLPLGIFVFFLTAVAFYYARKEELARRKWKRLMNAYVKKQLKQKEIVNADDYYEMKLEEALGQLDLVTSENLVQGKEDAESGESDCSEKDVIHNVT